MRKLILVLLVVSGCGSVDSAQGRDGATGGVTCPVEDYTIAGGPTNMLCWSTDLYTLSSSGEMNGACTTTGACSQTAAICMTEHIQAKGSPVVSGLCAYTGTRTWADEAGDCLVTCQISGVAPYSTLMANAGAPTSD